MTDKPWKKCKYITKKDYCRLYKRICLMDTCPELKKGQRRIEKINDG